VYATGRTPHPAPRTQRRPAPVPYELPHLTGILVVHRRRRYRRHSLYWRCPLWRCRLGAGRRGAAHGRHTGGSEGRACLIFPVGYVEETQELPFQHLVPTWDALRRFTGEEHVSGYDAGLVPDFEAHASLMSTALAALEEEERARFAAKTATSRAQQEEAERQRAKYGDQAISAKYRLRYLRRDLREEGAIPPDLPPALGDVDPPEPDTDTTEKRL